MFLTGEGALLAVALTALVCGTIGAWAVLRWGVRQRGVPPARREVRKAAAVRRAILPAEIAPKV